MLFDGVQPAALRPIRLSIGEPQHRTPELIREAIASHLDGLAVEGCGDGPPRRGAGHCR